jgi:putative addiction module component (TIGR02574 family)
MESSMGIKDAVRALLERLPDDCNLDDVIDRLYDLQVLEGEEPNLPPLTQAQRSEIDRRLDRLMEDPSRTVPWREVRRDLEPGEHAGPRHHT